MLLHRPFCIGPKALHMQMQKNITDIAYAKDMNENRYFFEFIVILRLY